MDLGDIPPLHTEIVVQRVLAQLRLVVAVLSVVPEVVQVRAPIGSRGLGKRLAREVSSGPDDLHDRLRVAQ